jgi:hypothetical protein
MLVKQIDKKTALELAVKDKEILVMTPNIGNPEWSDYVPLTLEPLLGDCLFFRREPALEVPMFDESAPDEEGTQPETENSSGGAKPTRRSRRRSW